MKNTRKHRDNKKLFMTDELKSIHNIRMIKLYNKKNPKKFVKIPDLPNTILKIDGAGLEKTNALLNLINQQHGIDKMYLYAKG